MDKTTIPPKSRPEWKKLVNGGIDYKFRNFVLQLKFYQLQKDVKAGKITDSAAVYDLYMLCCKYSLAVHGDMVNIFKEW